MGRIFAPHGPAWPCTAGDLEDPTFGFSAKDPDGSQVYVDPFDDHGAGPVDVSTAGFLDGDGTDDHENSLFDAMRAAWGQELAELDEEAAAASAPAPSALVPDPVSAPLDDIQDDVSGAATTVSPTESDPSFLSCLDDAVCNIYSSQ